MKNIFLLSLASVLFFSCGSDSDTKNIEALEKKVEETKSTEDAEALLEAYNLHIENNPDDIENNARYLYRSASTMFRMNRFATAADYLKRSLKDYSASAISGKTSELLAEIYDSKLQNPDAAVTIRQAMISAFPDYEDIAKVKEKTPGDAVDFSTRMIALTTAMFNDSTGRINYRLANNFILDSELHVLVDPNDEQNPTFLHRAAETARSVRIYPKAMEFYRWIYTKYPESERAPQALFLHAFTLDNDMKQYEEAKVLYEEFLQKYPENDFADDTQFLLENLGKSEEELIKSFEKKNQNQ